jgi:hypothetical protein
MIAKGLAVLLALAITSGCRFSMPVTVRLTPSAADQRLARGKSDVIEGPIDRSDATHVYIETDGGVEAIPRGDISGIDSVARQIIIAGGVGVGLGALAMVVGVAVRDCTPNKVCTFENKTNFWGGVAFVGGALAVGYGALYLIRGLIERQRVVDATAPPPRARLDVTPTVIAGDDGDLAPGLGVSGRF